MATAMTPPPNQSDSARAAGSAADADRFQAELPSADIAALAARHAVVHERSRPRRVRLDLETLERRFVALYASIADASVEKDPGTRAEEWLLDNRHIVEQAFESIRVDMPAGFLRRLPVVDAVDSGVSAIRVLQLARFVLSYDHAPLEIERLVGVGDLYQTTAVLSIAELWALPAMLRFVILESLAKDAETRREEARRTSVDGTEREHGSGSDATGDVASHIISLRHLDSQDWSEVFERLCRVHGVLGEDPAGAYSQMDFESRDRYRKVVEALARDTGVPETEVAGHAVDLAGQCGDDGGRECHAGYYLVDDGRPVLEQRLGYRPSAGRRLHGGLDARPALAYFGLYLLLALPPLLGFAAYQLRSGIGEWQVLVITLLASIPVSGLAIALLNGLLTRLLAPRALARLDFDKGIPSQFRTAVVMPVLFGGTEDVDHVMERIEINFLNNDDGQIVFAVLSDWADAPEASMPGDDALLERAADRIRNLNERYGSGRCHGPFLLLHRKRLWNDAEACWMSWERKRGKLAEFNHLLGGDRDTTFETYVGERRMLEGVAFVITLDADTHLPPGAARRLAGTMAHPLNRAVVDETSGELKAGYSILQPRLEVDPESTIRTRFTEIFSGDTTVDLYTHAVSDVYFDLFGEGIYAGKGLYDWRAFERTLHQRIPENVVLSHDLLEGIHGRVALVSDVALFEQYPGGVLAFMRRLHRWVRGDWQLLPWLMPMVPSREGRWFRNPVSAVHQWKMLENLRRSLQPPAVLLLLTLVWVGLVPGAAWLWTLAIAAFLGAPLIAGSVDAVAATLVRPSTIRQRLRHGSGAPGGRLKHWLLSITLLPFESYIVLDAVGRTLFRLLVSRRRLLQWTSAAHVDRRLGSRNPVTATWLEMWFSPAFAIGGFALVAVVRPASLPVAVPLLVAWLVAPQLASWLNRPLFGAPPLLTRSERLGLRNIARRTWLFFEHFVTPDSHWLPPDNYQEDPLGQLARRTSPTNMGMALSSALAAYDLGYVDAHGLVARVRNSFDGMSMLERYRGHWLNWYETLEPHALEPRYVSTVDSGNLAASLMTLARGLEEIVYAPVHRSVVTRGIIDTIDVLRSTLERATTGQRAAWAELAPRLDAMEHELDKAVTVEDERRWVGLMRDSLLGGLSAQVVELAESGRIAPGQEELAQIREWIDEAGSQLGYAWYSFDTLQPWLRAFEEPPSVYADAVPASPVHGQFARLRTMFEGDIRLVELGQRCRSAVACLAQLEEAVAAGGIDADGLHEARTWNDRLRGELEQAADSAERVVEDLRDLAAACDRWVSQMDFAFLYDETRHLFRIGYNVSNDQPDPNYYDLFASEARLASFIAIAKGDVPARHWLHLGRPFRRVSGDVALMSWGATLFEYLMPGLFMSQPQGTLLSRACRTAVAVHRAFAVRLKLPWGISESGYYELDQAQHYQYRAFGVPALGFRRDLGDRLVISPYSSLMALSIDSRAVLQNVSSLAALDMVGKYGFYEAVDFGRSERTAPRRARIVKSYMSHHQGMALLAVDNFLNGDPMVRRFHGNPLVARVSMLLHERLPGTLPAPKSLQPSGGGRRFSAETRVESLPVAIDDDAPLRCTVLSNGHYSVLLNSAGGGSSHWEGVALTRPQYDPSGNAFGQWVYVKDRDDGSLFSIARDPTGPDAGEYLQLFGPHTVQFQRRAHGLFCRMDVAVSPHQDIEVRKATIHNVGERARRLLVADFAELALAPADEFNRHPAFARLFVESESLPDEKTLVYRRRPRGALDRAVYLVHSVVVSPEQDSVFVSESDRGRFLGRGGRPWDPRALQGVGEFGGSTGAVLDPAIACGVEVEVPAGATIEVAFVTAVGRSRTGVLSAIRSCRSMARVNWIFEQARMQSEQELHDLRIRPEDFPVATAALTALMSPRRALRAPGEFGRGGNRLQLRLWSRGISGDRPLIVVRVRPDTEQAVIDQVLAIHTWLCGRQVPVDLVLVDEESGGYEKPSRDRLEQATMRVRSRTNRRLVGTVFILPANELSQEVRTGIDAAAHLVLDSGAGSLGTQLARGAGRLALLPSFVPVRSPQWRPLPVPPLARPGDLLFDNGRGGFSPDGTRYLIHLEGRERTPAPWSNVIANPRFGCLVTEVGTSCTWAGNSSERRLTPWPNDPVVDLGGEAIYIRDEETGALWSPTPEPLGDGGTYQVTYGAGYAEFRHNSPAMSETYRVHVDDEVAVKISRLELTNHANWDRRITVTCYAQWVLGVSRENTAAHIRCGFDSDTRTMMADNGFDRLSGSTVAFLTASLPPHGLTADRAEFLGRGCDTRAPAALHRVGLSGDTTGVDDPCAAYQVHIDLPAGATRSVCFVLGQGDDQVDALALAKQFQDPAEVEASFERARQRWERLLGAVQVQTPEPATDLVMNRWLLYQVLAARVWGRTGYYQSSGAYGFRDQLQDVMALTWSEPSMVREHILRAAAKQFQQGDVLHWWHEAPLRGVRTRCSDDMLWLPFVTAHYVTTTGDDSILDEEAAYLSGPVLRHDETEKYAEFVHGDERGTVYEHCCRAIEYAATEGPHGLPTIGSGDWNDGFNRIGADGRGESVWLAWFLARVCDDFAAVCDRYADPSAAHHFRDLAGNSRQTAEQEGWDGAWYRRAYYGDGTPVGSIHSDECRIDLIAQAWSVIGGEGPTERARRAMTSAGERLVRKEDRLILLLAPPFDKGRHDPGYIKGYPPGIRENGGQYTHAATWAVWACAALGEPDEAMELFRLLNPVLRSADPKGLARYRVEPYVLAGDIYGVAPHVGRGGWTWYTGAAAWLYRAGVEALLGVSRRGEELEINPCLPPDWAECHVSVRRGDSLYQIDMRRAEEPVTRNIAITCDGQPMPGSRIPFVDDGRDHLVKVVFRASGARGGVP